MKAATVRKSPVTGLGNRGRSFKSAIYLKAEWLNKKVFVVERQEMLDLLKRMKKLQLKVKRIGGIVNGN